MVCTLSSALLQAKASRDLQELTDVVEAWQQEFIAKGWR